MIVTDPEGHTWEVSRTWLTLPRWRRGEEDPSDWLGLWDIAFLDSVSGLVVGLVVTVVIVLVLVFFVPLLFLLAGLVIALAGLLGRVSSVTTWDVVAEHRGTRLVWRVRGFLRSRRALHQVATAIRHGDEPLVGGHSPTPS